MFVFIVDYMYIYIVLPANVVIKRGSFHLRFISDCYVILFHLCLVISVKTVGIAKITTIMERESTKPKSIAIPNIIRVVQRVLPDGEVRCRYCTLLLFWPTMDMLLLPVHEDLIRAFDTYIYL